MFVYAVGSIFRIIDALSGRAHNRADYFDNSGFRPIDRLDWKCLVCHINNWVSDAEDKAKVARA